jgi:A/G-specific adenine glycosylase
MVAFAFGGRSLVLDINIRRLFARIIDGVETPKLAATKDEKSRYEALIPKKDPHLWAAATMELGALICTSQSPKCGICPVANDCTWRSLDYPKSDLVKRTQSWHGTDRQCRGTVVQALRENDVLTKAQIAQLWDVPSQLVTGAELVAASNIGAIVIHELKSPWAIATQIAMIFALVGLGSVDWQKRIKR